jgi:hypothetical protein
MAEDGIQLLVRDLGRAECIAERPRVWYAVPEVAKGEVMGPIPKGDFGTSPFSPGDQKLL